MSKWKQLLLVMCVIFITSTHAQNQPLACQGDKAAGLKWEDGRWKVTGIITEKFILVLSGSNLDNNSVSKLFLNARTTRCQTVFEKRIVCFSENGGFLFFDPSSMKGAWSLHIGAISDSDDRDTPFIEAFRCQPF